MNRLRRLTRAFGSFWWDFLIGDTPELFVAVIVVIVTALVLRHHHLAAIVLLPALAIISLLASAWRGRKQTDRR